MTPLVFIVEDDDNIRQLVCYALHSAGFDTRALESGGSFWHCLDKETPNLVLLDIMLPDEDGLSILSRMRGKTRTRDIPVIMLTAKGTEYDRVKGLDSGADDYISKPFSVLELISRIKAVLRRAGSGSDETVLRTGALTLDTEKHRVEADGQKVELTLKEFELLQYLMRQKDAVLTRDQILTRIWGYEYDGNTNRTIDMHIKTLRQKLGIYGDMIKTVRGVGYKLSAEQE